MQARVFGAAVALAACGSARPPGQSAFCTITLSGGATGTYDCMPATTSWSPSSNRGRIGFQVSSCTALQDICLPAIAVIIDLPGEPRAGTYSDATAGISSSMSARTSWTQSSGDGGTSRGSFTLTLTSVSTPTDDPMLGRLYDAEGTLAATLVSDGADAVQLRAAF